MISLNSHPASRIARRSVTLSVLPLLSLVVGMAATGCDVAAVDRLLDDVRDGGADTATSPCAAVLCAVGTHCEEQPVVCVKAPCPPIAACVPNTDRISCGGIAGIKCPGSGQCVDDPTDSCDPKAGGADCGGICQCGQTVKCQSGQVFDSGLKVCACVPAPVMCGPVCEIYCEFGNVLDAQGCPTCKCNPPPTKPPLGACATVKCAAGTHCEEQVVMCIQAPCPPVAACVPDAPKLSCGGIAGIKCPGGGQCVDDPADTCDPKTGGADCGGICQCSQLVKCRSGQMFDSSLKVCDCVPAPVMCGPVCDIYCEYGNVPDAQGCPTCKCNPPPPPPVSACATVKCAAGTHCEEQVVMCIQAPCPAIGACVPDAPKLSCGGIAGIKCPGGGQCVDDPADTCDPKTGGADCGGICQCVQKVDCAKSQVFDSSVKVCACVPAPVMCGPVCAIYCEYGNVTDAQGCPTCKCNQAPTPATK